MSREEKHFFKSVQIFLEFNFPEEKKENILQRVRFLCFHTPGLWGLYL